jgi:hypothetical protein
LFRGRPDLSTGAEQNAGLFALTCLEFDALHGLLFAMMLAAQVKISLETYASQLQLGSWCPIRLRPRGQILRRPGAVLLKCFIWPNWNAKPVQSLNAHLHGAQRGSRHFLALRLQSACIHVCGIVAAFFFGAHTFGQSLTPPGSQERVLPMQANYYSFKCFLEGSDILILPLLTAHYVTVQAF